MREIRDSIHSCSPQMRSVSIYTDLLSTIEILPPKYNLYPNCQRHLQQACAHLAILFPSYSLELHLVIQSVHDKHGYGYYNKHKHGKRIGENMVYTSITHSFQKVTGKYHTKFIKANSKQISTHKTGLIHFKEKLLR